MSKSRRMLAVHLGTFSKPGRISPQAQSGSALDVLIRPRRGVRFRGRGAGSDEFLAMRRPDRNRQKYPRQPEPLFPEDADEERCHQNRVAGGLVGDDDAATL